MAKAKAKRLRTVLKGDRTTGKIICLSKYNSEEILLREYYVDNTGNYRYNLVNSKRNVLHPQSNKKALMKELNALFPDASCVRNEVWEKYLIEKRH